MSGRAARAARKRRHKIPDECGNRYRMMTKRGEWVNGYGRIGCIEIAELRFSRSVHRAYATQRRKG